MNILLTIPQEIIEHIAYFTATDTFLGPPSSLLPLLLANRQINSCLSITTNHHLYARIFRYKFDTAAPLARLGEDELASQAFAEELKRRCVVLTRLRARIDSTTRARHADKDNYKLSVHDVLFTAYILMLENDGKNEIQLQEYGQMKAWIREFWFDARGASLAVYSIRIGNWPPDRPETALAMWLFWFLLDPDDYTNNCIQDPESPFNILKLLALCAHKYCLTTTSWLHFEPQSTMPLPPFEHGLLYSKSIDFNTPPLATPAILSFFALLNKQRSIPLPPSNSKISQKHFQEWNCDWERCFTVASPKRNVSKCFRPGSMEGVWEGFFTYTEFTAYAALLAGAPPNIIQRSVVGRHQQTWKLREHHLITTDDSGSDSGIDLDIDTLNPLGPGDPLRSYFPTGTQLKEYRDGLTVQEPGFDRVLRYQRSSSIEAQKHDHDTMPYVQDIIITGEGHSAWGQFNLVGRVRPCDGFVSLSKDYVDRDRGKWLYRGYLVGNAVGNFAGRWRDTLSPAGNPGYEGSFAMSRRR
ncbi:hypothetical protein BYT27DRAFT_7205344 [Phlegmacium glaucopus]|nr:hypothetical protein BYT27DRAFT_7205344 [Phlegmacium glaucopus]